MTGRADVRLAQGVGGMTAASGAALGLLLLTAYAAAASTAGSMLITRRDVS